MYVFQWGSVIIYCCFLSLSLPLWTYTVSWYCLINRNIFQGKIKPVLNQKLFSPIIKDKHPVWKKTSCRFMEKRADRAVDQFLFVILLGTLRKKVLYGRQFLLYLLRFVFHQSLNFFNWSVLEKVQKENEEYSYSNWIFVWVRKRQSSWFQSLQSLYMYSNRYVLQ